LDKNVQPPPTGEIAIKLTVRLLRFGEWRSPALDQHPEDWKAKIIERIVGRERVIMFRVPWQDDRGELQVNRGFRTQRNSAIDRY
jgi:hypothetical protein